MHTGGPAPPPGCATYLLFALMAGWAIGSTVLVHAGAWLVEQILLLEDRSIPAGAWLIIRWGHALALALPLLLLIRFTHAPRFRSIYQTWALATGGMALLGLAQLAPRTATFAIYLAQIGLSLLLALAWLGGVRKQQAKVGNGLLLAASLSPLVSVPWLILGALGSPLDTLLAGLAGLTFGAAAALLLSRWLIPPLLSHTERAGWDVALGGFAAGVAVLLLAAGFGVEGMQLLLMVCLPPLGFAAVALARRAGPAPGANVTLPIAVLLGGAAAAPLLFVDPAEVLLLLGFRDLPSIALAAAGLSALLAVVVGFGLSFIRVGSGPLRRPYIPVVVVAAWTGAALLYLVAGQPGFYGDRLFVVLRDQADVTSAAARPRREERVRQVYTTLTRHAERSQAALRAKLDRLHVSYTPYYLVNALDVNGGPLVRAYLARQPEVDRVLVTPRLRPLAFAPPVEVGTESAPSAPPWNITAIGAPRVWAELGVTGSGIVVGQSDSGVQGDHPALRDGYRGRGGGDNYNWLDPWNGTRQPTDPGGHGTHTLGSAVGRGGIGVAPGASWIGCANLARNIGNPGYYLDCMQFMLAPYPRRGDPFRDGDPARAPHVLNNSWGCPALEGCDATALLPAVRALRAAGIFVVASAGNEGPRCGSVDDPIALYADVLSVGAVDEAGAVTSFSSRGPVEADGSGRVKPDLVAPGAGVLSALPGGSFGREDGTSMAGPHVVGVVALMWSAQPRLIGDIARTEEILRTTARPIPNTGLECAGGEVGSETAPRRPNNATGYGMVDAYAAVRAAQALR
jgi:subtilisin family serine protease